MDSGGTCVAFKELLYHQPHEYSIETCKMDKLFNIIRESCDCLPYNTPESYKGGIKICSPKKHFTCAINKTKIKAEDVAACHENCTSVAYRVQLSMSRLPDKGVLSSLKNGSWKIMKQDFSIAMESRTRHQQTKKKKNDEHLEEMKKIDETIRKLKLEPDTKSFQGQAGFT